jgi:hypothetical protein
LVLLAKSYGYNGLPRYAFEYLVEKGYNANFLWGFICGFDGRKLSEAPKTNDFLDGWRIGTEVYRYCKENNLIFTED